MHAILRKNDQSALAYGTVGAQLTVRLIFHEVENRTGRTGPPNSRTILLSHATKIIFHQIFHFRSSNRSSVSLTLLYLLCLHLRGGLCGNARARTL